MCGDPRIFDDRTKVPQVFRNPGSSPALQNDVSVATAVAQRLYDRIRALWLIPGNQAVSRFGIRWNQRRLLQHRRDLDRLRKFARGTVGEETPL